MRAKVSLIWLALAFTACVFMFSSCSGFEFFSAEQLIRPPKLTGENALIQEAFEAAVGSDVFLVSPISGEYRAAFVQYDLDNDRFEENIVFYTKAESPNEVRMHFLKFDGENWFSLGDITGNGSDVFDIDFFDLDNSGTCEIAVRWALSDSQKNKTLSLYKIGEQDGESDVSTLSVIQIYDYLVDDFDLDRQNELLYLTANSTDQEQPFRVNLIKLNPDTASFEFVCEIQLSSSITSPIQYLSDIKDGVYRFYIDCETYDGTYITEILCYDSENSVLARVQNEEGVKLSELTLRSGGFLCEDRDDDKIIEIPIERKYEGSLCMDYATGTEEPMTLISYAVVEAQELVPVEPYYFYSPENSFRFNMEAFTEDYIAVYDINGSQLRFFVPDNVSTPVFTVNFAEAANADGKSEFRVRIYDIDNEYLDEKIIEGFGEIL